MAPVSQRSRVVRRPNVPDPNPALLFAVRCVVAAGIACCFVAGLANAEEDRGQTTVSVTDGQSAPANPDDPGLWIVGRAYKWLMDNYTEFQVAWIGSFVLHELAYFGAYVPWLIVDAIPWCRRYKVQVTEVNTWARQWYCLKRLLMAHVFIQFPMMALFHVVAIDWGGMRMDLPLPSVTTLAWQIPVFFAIEDFYFYWVHRFLHWKKIYKYIHKVHHFHAAPFGIAAEYAHPVETIFLGLGTLLGPFLFADHLLTVWVWLVFRLWETVEDHSGYILPWYFNPTSLIPFWGGADHHDFHHENFDGNYADVFIIWDRVFGTDTKWREQKRIGRMNNKGRAEFEAARRKLESGASSDGSPAAASAPAGNTSKSNVNGSANGTNGHSGKQQLRRRTNKA